MRYQVNCYFLKSSQNWGWKAISLSACCQELQVGLKALRFLLVRPRSHLVILTNIQIGTCFFIPPYPQEPVQIHNLLLHICSLRSLFMSGLYFPRFTLSRRSACYLFFKGHLVAGSANIICSLFVRPRGGRATW